MFEVALEREIELNSNSFLQRVYVRTKTTGSYIDGTSALRIKKIKIIIENILFEILSQIC